MKKLLLTLLILSVVVLIASCNGTPDATTGDAPATTEAGAKGDNPTTKPNHVVQTLTIGGVDISEFVIVLGSNISETERYLVSCLQDKIYDVCGVEIQCLSHAEPESKYEILFGKTGREVSELTPKANTGSARQTDSKLAFVGNGTDGNGSMMRYLEFLLDAIPAGESYDIRIGDFDNMEIGQPHLAETNMPVLKNETGNYNPDFYASTENVLQRFLYSVENLPNEITVLDPFEIEDFATIQSKVVFVAPNGSDSNSGAIDAPFATLAMAMSRVNGGGVVYLREGVYDTTSSPVITVHGKTSSPVYVTSYQDESVQLISGKQISSSEFKPLDTENDELAKRIPTASYDNVVYVNLYELGWSESDIVPITEESRPSLLIGSTTGELSRYPNSDEDLLYFVKLYDTGSVSSDSGTGSYSNWIKRVKNWDTWKKSGASDDASYSYDTSIYRSQGEAINDAKALDVASDTVYIDTYGNLNLDYGWAIRMTDLTPFKDKWVNTGDIWFYGNAYAGFRFTACRIAEFDKQRLALVTANGIPTGAVVTSNSTTGYNNYYLFNVLEALDCAGEWYIDRASGNLYIYKTDDFYSSNVTYCTTSEPIINFNNSTNVIIDGLTISQGGGHGVYGYKCDDIVIQRCVITQTGGSSVRMTDCTDSAVICCDASDAGDFPIMLTSSSNLTKMFSPAHYVIQNNHVHDPRYGVKHGIYMCGVSSVASHNYLEDCNLYIDNAYECVVEYNDIKGGSRDVLDAGLIYLGGYANISNHVRYNYLHDWNSPNTGIYFDSLASFNYAYYNTIDSTTAKTQFARFLYSSSGHNNVFYGNMLVGRPTDRIEESTLFFDETMSDYHVFLSFSEELVNNWNKSNSTFFEHFPELKCFHTLLSTHVAERSTAGYVRNELEIYFCSPAGNVIMNNVALGGDTMLLQTIFDRTNSVTGEKMTSTDIVRNNYASTDISSVLGEYGNGKYDVQSSALSAVKSAIPDYIPLSTENVGLTY